MAHQAQDAFVAEIDGAPFAVQKGQVFPDNHPLVKLDDGRGLLFRALDIDPAPAKPAAKTAAKPARAAAG